MCTAAVYQTKDLYFGRTLDNDCSYTEEVTVTPRRFPLSFRYMATLQTHYAMIGMAHVQQEYPLYYDAVNEKGLAMAGLNFPGYADYKAPVPHAQNIAPFEFIPWILGQCASVKEARELIEKLCLTNTSFSPELPLTSLHWILADREETITVEPVNSGIRIYPNPVGILTNSPPFDQQLLQLNNYMHLSPKPARNRFSDKLPLREYSRGMGALGLPGDLSSQSRFVRAAFAAWNSVSGTEELESVNQFFHILNFTAQPKGCSQPSPGTYETTIYTSCCNTDKGIYYYTTYGNHQITAVDMHKEQLEEASLIRYPLISREQIRFQN